MNCVHADYFDDPDGPAGEGCPICRADQGLEALRARVEAAEQRVQDMEDIVKTLREDEKLVREKARIEAATWGCAIALFKNYWPTIHGTSERHWHYMQDMLNAKETCENAARRRKS